MDVFSVIHLAGVSVALVLVCTWLLRGLLGKGLFVARAGALRFRDSPGVFCIMAAAYVVMAGMLAIWAVNDIMRLLHR